MTVMCIIVGFGLICVMILSYLIGYGFMLAAETLYDFVFGA